MTRVNLIHAVYAANIIENMEKASYIYIYTIAMQRTGYVLFRALVVQAVALKYVIGRLQINCIIVYT